jgi:peptidoglycan/xylan/chitin deacetylase (PgdA/CDA1 family)
MIVQKMGKNQIILRSIMKYRRILAKYRHRKIVNLSANHPIISFTFDDAPKTAFHTGGDILKSYGVKATFFVSLGLLSSSTEVGTIASQEDLLCAVINDNELGCHTFNHLYSWETETGRFVESVLENKKELNRILPGIRFRTFAYPIGVPRPSVKLQLERHFMCCRGGGQATNVKLIDLNLLKAYFLDKRNHVDISSVKKIIDYNASNCGWLIFATHDVTENPSPFGCTPKFLDEVVNHAVRSGTLILTVREACERILISNSCSIAMI